MFSTTKFIAAACLLLAISTNGIRAETQATEAQQTLVGLSNILGLLGGGVGGGGGLGLGLPCILGGARAPVPAVYPGMVPGAAIPAGGSTSATSSTTTTTGPCGGCTQPGPVGYPPAAPGGLPMPAPVGYPPAAPGGMPPPAPGVIPPPASSTTSASASSTASTGFTSTGERVRYRGLRSIVK